MSDRTLSPLFTWRSAIASPECALSSTARLVALTLSLHMNERGASCFPSVATLAKETGLSDRSVQKSIALLEADGWLEVKQGGSPRGGRRAANTYRAAFPESYLNEAGEAGEARPVNEVRGSEGRPVNEATATGERGSPQGVKRGRKEIARAQTKAERLETQRNLEAWLETQGKGYAVDRHAFHGEIARFGVDPEYAEQLRLELEEKVRREEELEAKRLAELEATDAEEGEGGEK